MTGHAMPWNKEPSGQQKKDAKDARELRKKQEDLLKQQEAEISQRKKSLNRQQTAFLRSRFGGSGGSGASDTTSGGMSSGNTSTAGDLFTAITGR